MKSIKTRMKQFIASRITLYSSEPRLGRELVLTTLIVLGFFAIIVSAYLRYGIPYLHERTMIKLDETRIADINTLNTALSTLTSTTPDALYGTAKTVYISIPSDSSTCDDLTLPTLAEGWSYHCVATSTLANTDGTGWLPVDVRSTSNTLPIDSTNSADSLDYYAFVTTSTATTTQFAIVSGLDSKRYLQQQANSSTNNDPTRYVSGTSIDLWSVANGLIGYWPLNDSADSVKDFSSEHNNGRIVDTTQWNNSSLLLTGNGYVVIPSSRILSTVGDTIKDYTVAVWFKSSDAINQSISEKWSGSTYAFSFRGPSPGLRFGTYDGTNNPVAVVNDTYADNTWHFVVGEVNHSSASIALYVDSQLAAKAVDTTTSSTANSGAFTIGARDTSGQNAFVGSLSHFVLYARILSPNEIQKLYTALGYTVLSH